MACTDSVDVTSSVDANLSYLGRYLPRDLSVLWGLIAMLYEISRVEERE